MLSCAPVPTFKNDLRLPQWWLRQSDNVQRRPNPHGKKRRLDPAVRSDDLSTDFFDRPVWGKYT